ncbi:MAG: hypothetical protein ACJ746_20720, partial [Bryobacteraceae bacterium]
DLTLLLPEWMLFALPQVNPCRTLEMFAEGDRAPRGRDPSTDASPEWMAASPPPSYPVRFSI